MSMQLDSINETSKISALFTINFAPVQKDHENNNKIVAFVSCS